jgi:hypothetical protein
MHDSIVVSSKYSIILPVLVIVLIPVIFYCIQPYDQCDQWFSCPMYIIILIDYRFIHI